MGLFIYLLQWSNPRVEQFVQASTAAAVLCSSNLFRANCGSAWAAKTTQISSSLSTNRDCGPERVTTPSSTCLYHWKKKNVPHYFQVRLAPKNPGQLGKGLYNLCRVNNLYKVTVLTDATAEKIRDRPFRACHGLISRP